MKKKVIGLLSRVFENIAIDESSSQENIPEWDSMKQLNIAFEIENEFGIELEPEEIVLLKSVNGIINFLNTKTNG